MSYQSLYQLFYPQYIKSYSIIKKRKKQITSVIFNATDALAFWQLVVQCLVKCEVGAGRKSISNNETNITV